MNSNTTEDEIIARLTAAAARLGVPDRIEHLPFAADGPSPRWEWAIVSSGPFAGTTRLGRSEADAARALARIAR